MFFIIQRIFASELLAIEPEIKMSKLLEETSPEVNNLAILTNNKSELTYNILKSAFSTNRKLILITDKNQFDQSLLENIHMLIIIADANKDSVS